jgi:tetratricopeptide (TPR) repeat protein
MVRALPVIFVICLQAVVACTYAQCPDRKAVHARILYLADSLRPAPAVQLKELIAIAAEMRKCAVVYDSVYAFLLRRIGVLYYLVDDPKQAIAYTHAAIGVLTLAGNQGVSQSGSQAVLANCHSNLSVYYDALGMTRERDDARDSSILLYMTVPDSLDTKVLDVLSARVDGLFNTGDYYNAIYYADIANIITVRDAEKARPDQLNILTDKLNALLFLRQYERGRQALEGHEQDFIRSGTPGNLGNLYSIKAGIDRGLGNYTEALYNFQKAFAVDSKIKFNQGCAQTLNEIGFMYLYGRSEPLKALDYCRSALVYHDSAESMNIWNNMASAFISLNNYDSAFWCYQQALDQLKPGLKEVNLLSYPLEKSGHILTYLVQLLLNDAGARLQQAKKLRDRDRLKQAIALYRTTDKLLDRIRSGQSETGSQLFWRADNHRLYDRAIEACFEDNNTEDAFYFFEKSRAVLLNDRLEELSQASPGDLLAGEQLQKKIQSLEKELPAYAVTDPRYKRTQDELFGYRQQSKHLLEKLRRRSSVNRQGSGDSIRLRIGDVQRAMVVEKESLLELFVGDSALYTLTLSAGRSKMTRIDNGIYDSLSRVYLSGMTDAHPTKANFTRYESSARRLFRFIFPDTGLLAERIIISPDGHYFPFEALLTNADDRPSHYLIEDHAVSYTYSARYLMPAGAGVSPSHSVAGSLQTIPATGEKTQDFLGIAPVHYAAYLHLPELTGSDRSLGELSSDFREGRQLIGADASLRNFQQSFYKYTILQLYTHASSQSETGHPLIYFADSALSLADLIGGNRPATRLVVLSACETANGEFFPGEGIFSFNREFAAQGIPAAIANLWSVDNKATYRLTELFYKYLSSGIATDIALQKAKKEFLQQASAEQRLPYYWAAAVLTGKADVLVKRSGRGGMVLLLLVGVALVLVLGIGLYLLGYRRRIFHMFIPFRV